jgi:hypothetical protein
VGEELGRDGEEKGDGGVRGIAGGVEGLDLGPEGVAGLELAGDPAHGEGLEGGAIAAAWDGDLEALCPIVDHE